MMMTMLMMVSLLSLSSKLLPNLDMSRQFQVTVTTAFCWEKKGIASDVPTNRAKVHGG